MDIAKDHKVIVSLKDLEMFASPNATRQWLAADRFTIGLAIHPPGGSHDIHVHPDAEEMLYVISGNALIRIYKNDGTYDEYECGPNDFVHVPPGIDHSGHVIGWEPWKVICVYSPPGAEQYVMKGEHIIPRGEYPDLRWDLPKGKYVVKE